MSIAESFAWFSLQIFFSFLLSLTSIVGCETSISSYLGACIKEKYFFTLDNDKVFSFSGFFERLCFCSTRFISERIKHAVVCRAGKLCKSNFWLVFWRLKLKCKFFQVHWPQISVLSHHFNLSFILAVYWWPWLLQQSL